MEEKRKEVREYLQTKVNPLIRPLVEEIVRKRPTNIMAFISEYSNKMISQNNPQPLSDDEHQTQEFQQEFQKKLEEKRKQKQEKKVSRQAISAECFGIFNKKADFVPKIIEKDAATYSTILKLIEKSILFDALNKEDMRIVIDAMEVIEAVGGQAVITEGEAGDTLYIIGSGEYDCSKLINGKDTFLKTYHAGQFFGELALMYDAPRAATIVCRTPGSLFGLDRNTFNNIVQGAATRKRAHYLQVLSRVDIFADMEPHEKDQLCDNLKEEEIEAGTYVVRQGESGDRFYLIASGTLVAEKTEAGTSKVVYEYKAGDYFGEIALIKNTVRQASVRAVSEARVVSVERDAFKRLLGPVEEILQRNMEKYKKFLDH